MKRINIPLPGDLHKKLRIRAVQEEKTLKNLVIELLEASV